MLLEVAELLLLEDVGELLANELQLLFVEDVDVLVDVLGEPWVEQDVLSRRPLLRHLLQHHLHDVDRRLRGRVLVLDLLVELLDCVEVADLVRLERHVAVQHGVEADACAPDVHWKAFVPHVLDDFRRDVRRGAALLEQYLLLLDLPTHAEVTNLDVTVPVEQDVVKLDIAVRHFVLVQVGNALHDLLEHKLGVLLAQLPPLSHVVEQVSAWAELHDDHVMLICLESLQNLDVVRVPQALQNIDLIHNLLLLAFLLHEVHVDALDCAELPSQPVQAQIDLAKGAFAEHLANLVQLQLRLRRLVVFAEAVHDKLPDEVHLLGPRRQLRRVLLALLDVLEDVLLVRVRRHVRVPLARPVASAHSLRLAKDVVRQVDADHVLQVLVHLHHGGISAGRLLQQHVVLPCSLDGAVFRRVDLAEFGEGEDLLARLPGGALVVARGVRALMALHNLPDDVLLLLEVLIYVLLAHLILVLRRGLGGLEGLLGGIGRGAARLRTSSRRILQGVARRRWGGTRPPEIVGVILVQAPPVCRAARHVWRRVERAHDAAYHGSSARR